jgi:TolB-like protein/Flp pilus assembly protein TadD
MTIMASLIPGYEYDIFISYRQKDNRHDGWVTEFVENLKGELESTFKEEISVYFDINPHDGLLEIHDVDASLKDKLKCLIFIPIISRTYCDPKSFAWEHEFKAFIEEASKDQFGLKIKLPDGNVASRILPVRIHDLKSSDIELCESVMGGVLRGIEFTYKEPGVNRPLIANEENPHYNQNHTTYRNQMNKVANAVNEIIDGLKNINHSDNKIPEQNVDERAPATNKSKLKIIIPSVIIIVILGIGYILLNVIFKPSEQFEKSIAVLPFRNDSPNDSTAYFIDGVMEEILTNLQTINDLRVISRTSVEQYRGPAKPTSPEIAKKLGVNYLVEGSGQKYGNKFRLRVQLIRAANENHLWAKSYEQEINKVSDIFDLQSRIAETIAEELKAIITPTERNLIRQRPTNDTIAYQYYLKGNQDLSKLKFDMAIDMFGKAIEHDPDFVLARLVRADIYSTIYFSKGLEYNYSGNWNGYDRLAKEDLEKAVKINPDLPEVKFEQAVQFYSFDRKYDKALELLSEVENQMSNNPTFYIRRGAIYRRMGKWEQSISDWQKTILLDPLNASAYIELGHTYRLIRKYPEAIDSFNKSLLLDQNPENKEGIFLTMILWKGDLQEALNIFKTRLSDKELREINYYYYNRQYDILLANANEYEDQFNYFSKSLNLALSYLLNANIALSRKYAESAIPELKLKIKEHPDDDRYYAALGYAYAINGEKKKAIENIQKAIKLKPLKLDAWQGYYKEIDLLKIHIINGDYDLAMDKIEFLLSIPGDISIPLLRVDPAFDKLRALPRFQKLLTTGD